MSGERTLSDSSINRSLSLLIPRELLFSAPLKYSPKISPDGKRISYVAPTNDILNLWIRSVDRSDDRAITGFEKRGIRLITGIARKGVCDYLWVTDRYIVYLQDTDGDENWQLYRLNPETGEVKNLTPYKNIRARIFTYNRDFPYEIVILMNKEEQTIYNLYRINILSGKLTLIGRNPGNVINWVIDSKLQLLGMVLNTDDGGEELVIKGDEEEKWLSLVKWVSEEQSQNTVIGCSKDDRYIYIIDSRNTDTCCVAKVEIATGKSNILAYDMEYDIWDKEDFLYNPATCEIQAVYFNKFRKEWIILDETIKEDFEAIKKLDTGDFSVVSRDDSDETWIIAFERDDGPVAYYSFNRKFKKGSFLFYNKPSLNEYTLSRMEEISFTSRDGLIIHGYITYPQCKKKNNLPLVLYVHGGPWWRDTWGYNPTVQWFASRGYACLQINYRGSIGYGKNFFDAGNREWGGKMQDDLIDGVYWAIKEGIADPAKIAIYGTGYGGYAALVGATFTPDLFCCALSIGSSGDLITFIQSIPSYWKAQKKEFIRRIGDPEKEKEFLISRSPFYRADQIRIPILISYGLNDQRIKAKESYEMVRAIKSKGIDVEYIVFSDEGYPISKGKNLIKLHLIAEKFLARYMGGRYEDRPLYLQDKHITICDDKNFDDRDLIDKILKEEDREAFELLMEHYRKPLLKHMLNMTGDLDLSLELLQETFFRVWKYLYTYRFHMTFFSWIYKIATNVAIKCRRIESDISSKKINLDEMELDNLICISNENMDDKIFIESMLSSLKEPYKTAMYLRFVEDMDYKEIAAIIKSTPNQVKNYLFRAKKNLAASMIEPAE